VVIAMVQLKPTYTREFNEHNLKEALSKALETLSDVDKCMLFAGDDHKGQVSHFSCERGTGTLGAGAG
jgi:hypothetical protein